MSNRPSLDDYIDVAERITAFKEKYPEGSLQTISWGPREIGGKLFIVYRAAAYRDPDDPRPGHGTAWEPFPGPTPYTRDSELMNAETAAWGRACVAVGVAANRKIASRQEVKARQSESDQVPSREAAFEKAAQAAAADVTADEPQPTEPLLTSAQCGLFHAQCAEIGLDEQARRVLVYALTGQQHSDRIPKRLLGHNGSNDTPREGFLGVLAAAKEAQITPEQFVGELRRAYRENGGPLDNNVDGLIDSIPDAAVPF